MRLRVSQQPGPFLKYLFKFHVAFFVKFRSLYIVFCVNLKFLKAQSFIAERRKGRKRLFRRNTVSAQASVVPDETVPDQADNTFINGNSTNQMLGDVDGDGKVGFEDLLTLANFTG